MKGRQFLKKLKQAGCTVDRKRGKGGHVWVEFGGASTTFPMHGDVDFGPEFLKDVCKQLGLDPRKVL